MALLLGALMILGLTPGPKMLKEELPMALVIVWTLGIANVFAAAQIILLANPMAKLAALRPSIIVPAVLAIAALGAYATTNNFANVIVAGIFGIVGYEMKRHGFSRATLIIGLVLGASPRRTTTCPCCCLDPVSYSGPSRCLLLAVAASSISITVKGFGRRRRKRNEEAMGLHRGDALRRSPASVVLASSCAGMRLSGSVQARFPPW